MLLFSVRLAKVLGKTLREIQDLDYEELLIWIAYQQLEGLAPVDSWLQTAATNFYIDRGAGQKNKKIDDYMPIKGVRKKRIMSAQEQVALIRAHFPCNATTGV